MKKRIWGSLLLAGLVLLSSRSAVAETTRQESIRILFEALAEQEKSGASLSAEEAAARSQCIDPSCAHVSVDEEGNVTALCPYGQYLLSANPYMVFSANPVDRAGAAARYEYHFTAAALIASPAATASTR